MLLSYWIGKPNVSESILRSSLQHDCMEESVKWCSPPYLAEWSKDTKLKWGQCVDMTPLSTIYGDVALRPLWFTHLWMIFTVYIYYMCIYIYHSQPCYIIWRLNHVKSPFSKGSSPFSLLVSRPHLQFLGHPRPQGKGPPTTSSSSTLCTAATGGPGEIHWFIVFHISMAMFEGMQHVQTHIVDHMGMGQNPGT